MANDSQLLVAKSILPVMENQVSKNNSFLTNKSEKDELLENTLYNIRVSNSLTRRETEILNLIVAGNTNKEISQKISRTERTIEYHRNRLMHKLGSKTAADLVKRAITMGII